ncbi:3-hydroxyacyl-CoA dehydrogenase NAD-binding domain-containing protein [Niveispirillum sp. KHB5.9]|uniref:3-hydroxyacyl-CoA dehydrogenase NAD-binding domain-containing protein n=1 Tax=Niveispirillum sp. KHB5.9 TaxID=3400269 RepID=UPI003A8B476A
MRHVVLTKGADGIAILTLNNEDESVNLVTQPWLAEMEAAIADLTRDSSVTGVILTSAKKGFMAGADLKLLVDGFDTMSRQQAYAFSQRATTMHRAIEKGAKPWVAALNGLALGGGFELALACHYRILVDDPKAVVGLPEVNVGLLPGSGGTQRLLRLAGAKTAADLLLSGRAVRPEEALKLRIVDEVVPAAELADAARSWLQSGPDPVRAWDRKGYTMVEARGLLVPETAVLFSAATAGVAKGGRNSPAAISILSCLFEGGQLPFDRALSVESKYFARLLTDPVARNIIRTSFLSKQAAERGFRRPAGVAPSKVAKVGVLGAGMMGAGIALVSAQAGIEVVLLDRTPELAAKGRDYAARVLGKEVEKGRRSAADADAILSRLHPTADFADLAGVDLVVEAVFEDTGVKTDTTARAEAVIPPGTLFASNTSTLPITQLAEASKRPHRFIGLHFFSPVERMGLVEVIIGRKTSPETLAQALDYVAQLRKTPIVVNDSRGFYTSRVFQTFIHEGASMLAEGVPPAVIENAARAAGMPVGPLALLDEVTLDLPLKIVDQTISEEGDRYTPPPGVPVLRRMRDELGRSSRKAGGGFYEYPAGGRKHLWPGLAQHFPSNPEFDAEKLARRFLYIQAMETARCLEEGVLTTPQDGDLGAVYGWGFPLWTGGTLSYIDTIGIVDFVAEADRLAQTHGPRYAPSPWLRERATRGESFYAKAGAACAA